MNLGRKKREAEAEADAHYLPYYPALHGYRYGYYGYPYLFPRLTAHPDVKPFVNLGR